MHDRPQAGGGKPRLSLCMIVRDEASSLPRCLRSVEGVYDELIVVDTGSRDRTVEVAREHGARVLYHSWQDDFSAARNYGLDHATGDWILWLDADDELAPEDRGRVRPLLGAADVDGYFCPTLSLLSPLSPGQHVRNLHLRLFRRRPEHRFRGAIHEYVTIGPGRYRVAPVRVVHHGYDPEVVQGKDKVRRNLRILQRLVREEPGCALWHFYLGCELDRAGEWAASAAAYERARELLGPDAGWAPDLWRRSAIAWMRVGDHGRAHAALQEGIARHPDYTDLHFLLGLLWHRVGRYDQALRVLGHALELGDPPPWYTHDHGTGSFRALTALAQVHHDLGNWHEAARLSVEALRLQPDYPGPTRLLVVSLIRLYGRKEVRRALRAALRSSGGPLASGAPGGPRTPGVCGVPAVYQVSELVLATRLAACLQDAGDPVGALEWAHIGLETAGGIRPAAAPDVTGRLALVHGLSLTDLGRTWQREGTSRRQRSRSEPWFQAALRQTALRQAHPWHLPAYVDGARAWLSAIPPLLRARRSAQAKERLRRLRVLRLWRWEVFTACD